MAERKTAPEWLRTILREARVRRGLVIYGNVRDLFFDEEKNSYVTFPELLLRRLTNADEGLGITIAGIWDNADGLRFADDKMERRFGDVMTDPTPGQVSGGKPFEVDDTPLTVKGLYSKNFEELLIAFRQLLLAKGEKPAIIVDWSHLLVTESDRPDSVERDWLTLIGKALVGPPVTIIDSDSLKSGSGGLLVLVAATLGAVPPVLYQGDPRVRLIPVPVPSRDERKAFFERHRGDLELEQPRSAAGIPKVSAGMDKALVETLCDLTDQLSLMDLKQILMLSKRSGKVDAQRLLNLYRFGEQHSPWEDLSEDKVRKAEEILRQRVKGQDAAVRHVATMIVRAYMGLAGLQHSSLRAKPKGTLFFVGPTGVGKTELAKACAELLFGDENSCIRFDMSEYNHEHSDQRLVGAPPGYVGFEEGGQLTNSVRERPFSVLLFDEVEKADGRVLDKFLQILEDGRLTDGRGETAHFSECVLIFTSNLGSNITPKDTTCEGWRTHFRSAVEKHFVRKLGRPELLNRFGENIVVFDHIKDEKVRRDILERKLHPLHKYLEEKWGVKLEIKKDLEEFYLKKARLEHGGRGLLNELERDLLNPLALFLFERRHQLQRGRIVAVSLVDDAPDFELKDA